TAQWDTHGKTPVLNGLSESDKQVIEYEYTDEQGNVVPQSQLEAGKSYNVQAHIKDEYANNYEFVGEDGEVLADPAKTGGQTFEMKDYDPDDLNDPKNPNSPNYNPNGNDGGGNADFGKVGEVLKQWWQVIASVISIILIIIFTSKGIGYANKRKRLKKTIDRYANYYAGTTGLFGLAMTAWTTIACVLMVLAVVSLVFMIIEKHLYNKTQEELEDAKDEYNRNQRDLDDRKRDSDTKRRDEDLKMILMSMLGGNAGGNGAGPYVVQQGLGADEIRGIVSETMTALLPGVQQMLPQQASSNDELVNRLIEQNEMLMQRLSEQSTERIVEREVAATSVDDDAIKQMMKTQENLMHNQEKLMEKILELSATQPQSQVQVIEKEVPVEKIVEKVVEVPVEKIVEVPV
ncbi:MAG: hypothetical protein K2I23_00110, partial [Clostridia bacterium]|nr:hypothetical protein [Clostridia bacterium]